MRTAIVIGLACMACGAEPGQSPEDGGGVDAAAEAQAGDAASDRPDATDCPSMPEANMPGGACRGRCLYFINGANCGACGNACTGNALCTVTPTGLACVDPP